ncbi:RNA dependent RNA polymerase-domain-containing protein [Chaetomidium leptoderma]|uniref:RNA dependent RNA polymerase-domain-containing protein n=1 Tax=Chaetomidium leptoderma TaxID=669021 RepID=A0AAN6ZSW3_9PEZI|nr:RNA dependent RNA polymerase-domain-containing protein [Chaetomidium leptoderma]
MAPNTATNTAPKKSNLSAFRYKLQDHISLDDREWKFHVPNLPSAPKLDERRLVKTVSLLTTRGRNEIVLTLETASDNRAIRADPLHRFLVVSIAELRQQPQSQAQAPETTRTNALQPSTARECADYATRLLKAGVVLQGVHYNFYGHSNSQLKSRTCFLYSAARDVISRKVESLGDFAKMKTAAKKAKRIGLLFSTAKVAMEVSPDRVEDIADIESADYIFTDGCGRIAPRLAQELARKIGIVFRDRRYTPSVLQIRYRGYKGVVTVDPTMAADKKVLLKMRKSMKKFAGGDDYSFSVVEYSKPYTYGFLNDEVIILLHALGIDRAVLKRKQEEHFRFLADTSRDPRSAFRFLSYVNMPLLAEKVLVDSFESIQPKVHALVKNECAKMLNKRDEQKCRILIPKSRLLFGVCDAWGVLKQGEPSTIKGCDVLVTRNPCLHPGDMQKLKAVEKPELAHLVDCIVFATEGRRPAADMMSGGHLDGDPFFVCWDRDIVPSTMSQPAQYPGVREPLRFKPITDDDRLEYFARYTNASLGRVKNLYLDWARARGPMAPECQELNRLFSQCVDGNRIRVPQKLEKAPPPPPDALPFILDDLHDAAKQLIQNAQISDRTRILDGYDFDAVELLLSREDIAISEFELLCITLRWCRKNGARLEDLLHLFDLNILTSEERGWVLQQLPSSRGIPALILNAVCSSNLLTEEAAARFQLNHHGVQWKRIFDSSRDRLATFLDSASNLMGLFHRKLLVLRAQECVVDDSVRLFAFPHSQGTETQSRISLPIKMTYRLYCDNGAFQLFEGQRGNTWIHIARGPSDDSSYRNMENPSDRRRQRQATIDEGKNFDFRVSIALDKVNRNGLSAAEIYVVSNRDVKSMRTLDLWLEHIDTETKLPLFESQVEEYTIPSMRDVSLDSEPDFITQIARRQNLAAFKRLETPEQFKEVFTWLLERDQTPMLLKSFDYLLSALKSKELDMIKPAALLSTMTGFLRAAPFLALSFGRMERIERVDEDADDLQTLLDVSSVEILRAYVLSSNQAQDLVMNPLESFLSRIPGLALHSFADLVELVALTVREPFIAVNVLLCFELESTRLLAGLPALTRYLVRNTVAIALDHIGEASEQGKAKRDLLKLKLLPEDHDGYQVVEIVFRIDSDGATPENSAHVRLTAATTPASAPLATPYSIDALVIHSEQGLARFQCFHPLPPFYERCPWKLEYCGPFTTAKTMFDAVRDFATRFEDCCEVANQILLGDVPGSLSRSEIDARRVLSEYPDRETLNPSQNAAVQAALSSPLTCLWGPPGTGKTETIVEMIRALQVCFDKPRILVTAPTHNAVDNVMRRYIGRLSPTILADNPHLAPLRVSTEIRKVAEDLRKYTCDAMVGQEIHANRKALDQAKRRVQNCAIIFTTCIGSGLGLLRSQVFSMVIIDEASQQTEPASLVPLVKGCEKAILVGDHVQLRPTVNHHSLVMDFDKSLFERLSAQPAVDVGGTKETSSPLASTAPFLARRMLDTQYRMHPSICAFSSTEFYDSKLLTGVPRTARPLFNSSFPWPESTDSGGDLARMVFVNCPDREDLGGKSKTNPGQAALCLRICQLLCTANPNNPKTTPSPPFTTPQSQSIVVLTPYARQAELLKRLLSSRPVTASASVEVSSIDGFQGREADVVVLVTVRCNERREIGFLRDLRRMNVALTRARAGVVVVGDRETLTTSMGGKGLWRRLIGGLEMVVLGDEEGGLS